MKYFMMQLYNIMNGYFATRYLYDANLNIIYRIYNKNRTSIDFHPNKFEIE